MKRPCAFLIEWGKREKSSVLVLKLSLSSPSSFPFPKKESLLCHTGACTFSHNFGVIVNDHGKAQLIMMVISFIKYNVVLISVGNTQLLGLCYYVVLHYTLGYSGSIIIATKIMLAIKN
jgi:hypothetical protein